MEYNRDEAARAKEMAEKKLAASDYVGAKKFALKAQSLFPGVLGIPHMLAVLDVYIAAENKLVNGEPDWYAMLGLDPRADEETLKKRYKKLALVLHPDKNKCPGADGVFKLMANAWCLLSDKAKKAAYDHKISNKHPQAHFDFRTVFERSTKRYEESEAMRRRMEEETRQNIEAMRKRMEEETRRNIEAMRKFWEETHKRIEAEAAEAHRKMMEIIMDARIQIQEIKKTQTENLKRKCWKMMDLNTVCSFLKHSL